MKQSNLKNLSKGLVITVTSSLITTTLFLIFIFTFGARMTEARAIFIAEEENLRNIDELSESRKEELKNKLQKSLSLWSDPEVQSYLKRLEN